MDDERLYTENGTTGERLWTLRNLDGLVLTEYRQDDDGWFWERDYIHRAGRLFASQGRGEGYLTHYHLDHLGTPRLVTRGGGGGAGGAAVLGIYAYHPFGEEASQAQQEDLRLRFTGHERDGRGAGFADDLDYMHARYYSPGVGRFLSVDRLDVLSLQSGTLEERSQFREYLRSPQSWNRYAYTKGNPLRYVDLNGEEATAVLGGGALLLEGGGAAAVGGAPLLLAGAVGVGLGYAVNQIPVVSEALTVEPLTDALANTFFSGGKGAATRDFITAKVATVFDHLARYSAPDPGDPNDQRNKKNTGDRMRKHLEAARGKLKRLKGKSREQYEKIIRRAEEALEEWISGGPST